jgi:hypothetical protein
VPAYFACRVRVAQRDHELRRRTLLESKLQQLLAGGGGQSRGGGGGGGGATHGVETESCAVEELHETALEKQVELTEALARSAGHGTSPPLLLGARLSDDVHVVNLRKNFRACCGEVLCRDAAFAERRGVGQMLWSSWYKELKDAEKSLRKLRPVRAACPARTCRSSCGPNSTELCQRRRAGDIDVVAAAAVFLLSQPRRAPWQGTEDYSERSYALDRAHREACDCYLGLLQRLASAAGGAAVDSAAGEETPAAKAAHDCCLALGDLARYHEKRAADEPGGVRARDRCVGWLVGWSVSCAGVEG